MTNYRFSFTRLLLTVVALTALTGCETGFVADAARGGLSSFVIDVMSTAVNETIDPED